MAQSMQEILNPNLSEMAIPGFPYAPVNWLKTSAERLAKDKNITLSPDHWDMLKALQEYYSRNQTIQIRALHDALDECFHAKGGMPFLYRLFPGGPIADGCVIAGLKPPAGSEDKSFGSVS